MTFLLRFLPLLLLTVAFSACIGDDIVEDYVEPQIRIDNPVAEIEAGTTYQFEASFLNNVGLPEAVTPSWSSASEEILILDQSGLATGVTEGETVVTVSYQDEFGETAARDYDVAVGASTVIIEEPEFRTGRVETTTFYDLEGDFVLSETAEDEAGDIKLTFGDDYNADDGLPGLFVYLSNNPSSTNGAFEIGEVQIFEGAHEYVIEGVDLAEYRYVLYFCKPFNVKVGDGEIGE